jgi:hypothetical protein
MLKVAMMFVWNTCRVVREGVVSVHVKGFLRSARLLSPDSAAVRVLWCTYIVGRIVARVRDGSDVHHSVWLESCYCGIHRSGVAKIHLDILCWKCISCCWRIVNASGQVDANNINASVSERLGGGSAHLALASCDQNPHLITSSQVKYKQLL